MELVISIVVAIFVAVLTTETYAWLPKISKLILDLAVRRLDPKDQERYLTEWNANLEDLPNTLLKLVHAISHYVAADRIKVEILDARWNSRYSTIAMFPDIYQDTIEALPLYENSFKERADELIVNLGRMEELTISISKIYFGTDFEHLPIEEKTRYLEEIDEEAREFAIIAYWLASGGQHPDP
jgi:hypothetical protein